jgi:hypothetical protein
VAGTRWPVTLHPLAAIVSELGRFEIPHMLAGSFASTYHGDPRTTNDRVAERARQATAQLEDAQRQRAGFDRLDPLLG